MAHNIHGKMVYSFEKPMWHNITEPSTTPMGAEEILDGRFGGGFDIRSAASESKKRSVVHTLSRRAVGAGTGGSAGCLDTQAS